MFNLPISFQSFRRELRDLFKNHEYFSYFPTNEHIYSQSLGTSGFHCTRLSADIFRVEESREIDEQKIFL